MVINEVVHLVKGLNLLFLSLDTCKKLKLIHPSFPHVSVNEIGTYQNVTSIAESHAYLPSRPENIPYPPTEENIHLLEKWLLESFSASTFNINATYTIS